MGTAEVALGNQTRHTVKCRVLRVLLLWCCPRFAQQETNTTAPAILRRFAVAPTLAGSLSCSPPPAYVGPDMLTSLTAMAMAMMARLETPCDAPLRSRWPFIGERVLHVSAFVSLPGSRRAHRLLHGTPKERPKHLRHFARNTAVVIRPWHTMLWSWFPGNNTWAECSRFFASSCWAHADADTFRFALPSTAAIHNGALARHPRPPS